jgi:hypothetical protein
MTLRTADVLFYGLIPSERIGSRLVEVDVAMMRGGAGIVNEMEF